MLTDFITYLLKAPRSREQAEQEARRLGIKRMDWAEYYWRTIG